MLDMLMQALWNETQTNPLGATFYSCVPYLLGPGQAMQYSFWPRPMSRTGFRDCRFGRRTTTCATT